MIDITLSLTLLFLLNPLASVPLLIQAYKNKFNVKLIAMKAVILAFVVALSFVIFGPLLFEIYNVNVDSFRAGGGILILLLGISMARQTDKEIEKGGSDTLISIIATPLLTGPATLSYLIITTAERGILVALTNLLLAFIMVAIIFFTFAILIPRINMKYVNFLSRLLGLFVLALGIQMTVKGIMGLVIPDLQNILKPN
ncbi:MAG: MarC family protein [Candidatus Anstonellales archaeon]